MSLGWTLDDLCRQHGWRQHVTIHEASHAIFAIVHGIEFVEVAIESSHHLSREQVADGWIAGGVLMLQDDPKQWVPQNPRRSLQFLLAGVVGEMQLLGHAVPMGFKGDLDRWRQGMGLVDGMSREEIMHWIDPARAAVETTLPGLHPRIKVLARDLSSDSSTRVVRSEMEVRRLADLP